MYELRHYVDPEGQDLFAHWLDHLQDRVAQARIAVRLLRLQNGNFGDCKPVGSGVWELRVDWGPGYRVYYAIAGKRAVLLCEGGDKRTQSKDIARASALERMANKEQSMKTCAKHDDWLMAQLADAEFAAALYGSAPSTQTFVSKLYSNVLHRAPDVSGYDYWVKLLEQGKISKVVALAQFSESPENQVGVAGAIQDGIWL